MPSFSRRDSLIRHNMKLHGNQCKSDNDKPTSHSILQNIAVSNTPNFHVSDPGHPTTNVADLVHPFSCKVVGPRGSGKTCFTGSYILQIACLKFKKIIIVTMSPDQELYVPLKEIDKIFFVIIEELEAAAASNKHSLIVLDDIMQEAHYNSTIQSLFTRGRHLLVSVMSLEQDMAYSNYVERRNVDYYILTRMRDTSCLNEFYKKYCQDIQHWRFIDLYEFAVMGRLGFLIIDFVSQIYKYRINSFNVYYDVVHNNLNNVIYDDNQAKNLEPLNQQLQDKFLKSISSFKVSKPERRMIKSIKTHVTVSNNPHIEEGCVKGVQDKKDENKTSIVELNVSNPIHTTTSLEASLPTNYSVETAKCIVCQEDFSGKHDLKRRLDDHLNNHHRILVSGKLKMCGFCNFSDFSLPPVIHHMFKKHSAKFEDGANLTKLKLLSDHKDSRYKESDEDSYCSNDTFDDCPTY
jgi:hypothetical protein